MKTHANNIKFLIATLNVLLSIHLSIAQICTTSDASGCVCPSGTQQCDLLPDITISVDLLEDEKQLYEIAGQLEISVSTPNIGYGPLRVEPSNLYVCGLDTFEHNLATSFTCPDGSEPKNLIYQRVYQKEGNIMTSYLRSAGAMTYHSEHNHMHVDDWGYYTIRKQVPGLLPTDWPVIGDGVKLGFCLMDYGSCGQYNGYCRDNNNNILNGSSNIPNYGLGGGLYSCGKTNQGISVGWTDVYFNDIPGMEIDIPAGTCNGNYKVVVEIDPLDHFLESNENNNIVVADLILREQSEKQEEALDLQGSKILCDGETVTLSANYGNSFLWSTGETSQSIEITQPGSYFCAIEVACGTIQSDTLVFTQDVIQAPLVNNTILICEPQQLTLTAQNNFNGPLFWFSDSTANNLMATTNTFQTPLINSTTAYWVKEEVYIAGEEENAGMPDNLSGSTAINGAGYNGALIFDVLTPFTLVSVKTYADNSGDRIFQILDKNDVVIHQKNIFITAGEDRAVLNFPLDMGINYKIQCQSHPGFYRNKNNVQYPYEVQDIVKITGTNFGELFYYYFYDWELRLTDRTCYSDIAKILIEFGNGNASGSLSISGVPSISENTVTYPLTGLPAGGQFSGNGVQQNNFNPINLSTGLNKITYTNETGSACESSVETNILIYRKNGSFAESNINTVKP